MLWPILCASCSSYRDYTSSIRIFFIFVPTASTDFLQTLGYFWRSTFFVICLLSFKESVGVVYGILSKASLPLSLWKWNGNISIDLKKDKWHGADLSYSQWNLLDIVFSCLISFLRLHDNKYYLRNIFRP